MAQGWWWGHRSSPTKPAQHPVPCRWLKREGGCLVSLKLCWCPFLVEKTNRSGSRENRSTEQVYWEISKISVLLHSDLWLRDLRHLSGFHFLEDVQNKCEPMHIYLTSMKSSHREYHRSKYCATPWILHCIKINLILFFLKLQPAGFVWVPPMWEKADGWFLHLLPVVCNL